MAKKQDYRQQLDSARELLNNNHYFPVIGKLKDMKPYVPSELETEVEDLLKKAYHIGTEKEWQRALDFKSSGKHVEALSTLKRVEKYAANAGIDPPEGFSEMRSELENLVRKPL